MAILTVHNLHKAFRKKPILCGVNLSIQPGQIVGLLGPNGAGKTTAFYAIMGLIHPDIGKIFFEENDITRLPIHKRSHLGIGYLAQEPSIFKGLTVEENILCVLEPLALSKEDEIKRLSTLLNELDLSHLAKRKADLLSGGERRRLEITRALAKTPKLLLLDEPFANVDPLTIEEMKKLIRHLKNRGISVLITDHNAREIFSIVDHCYLMQEGSITFGAPPLEWLRNASVKKAYLGESFSENSLIS